MRILWIEDEDHVLQDKPNLFGGFDQDHDVEAVRQFSKAYQVIDTELSRYDVLVIDIDLRHSESNSSITDLAKRFKLSSEDYLGEAGFHLYLGALVQGFPPSRMVFLTGNINPDERSRHIQEFKIALASGNSEEWERTIDKLKLLMSDEQLKGFEQALDSQQKETIFAWLRGWIGGEPTDNTYERFEERFKQARLIPPLAFDKKRQDCSAHLQNWLRSHCERPSSNRDTYDYLTLRRGMLDVIKEIENDLTVNLSPEFQTDLDKDTFLRGLAWLLHDFALPPAPQETIYLGLCDYLTKPFEKYRWPEVKNENQAHFKMPPYFLRNWLAHGLIIGSQATRLSAQEVGMTFLLVMQCLFGVEKYGFQEELKRLFGQTPITTGEVTTLLQKTGFPSDLDEIYNKGFKSGKHPNPDWRLENYVLLFYASYLVCIRNSGNTLQPTPFNDMVVHELQKYLA